MTHATFTVAIASIALMVSGCSTPGRLAAVPVSSMTQAGVGITNARFLVARETDSFKKEALDSLAKEKAWQAANGGTGNLSPAYFLAISGGGDNGAFGAGLLNGWTAAGTRPEFKAVTGVSTGALMAPFAFLGSRYDPVLEKVYTTISSKNVFKQRGLLKGVLSDGMADTRPLAELIADNTDQALLDVIAAEYAKGRLLLVATANLDAQEPVIWNMTAIAASKAPDSLQLFRRILLASASIPGAFPPVMIDVNVDGARYQEMHADGGTMAQVFLYPPSISRQMLNDASPRRRVLYVIRNARFDSTWESVPRKTMRIAMRAIDSLTTTQGLGDLYRIYATSARDGIEFNLAYIPPTFPAHGAEQFNMAYMRQLYATGRQLAQAGYVWQKYPPGFEQPVAAASNDK